MDILGDSEILLGTYEAFVLGYKLAEDAVRSGQYITHLSVSNLYKEYEDWFAWRATHYIIIKSVSPPWGGCCSLSFLS